MFILKIDTENDAFEQEGQKSEVIRILRKLADDIENGKEPSKVMDINGNTCGFVEWGI